MIGLNPYQQVRIERPTASETTLVLYTRIDTHEEQLDVDGHHRGLIVIAPHDGDIEEYTDEQAEHVGKQLSSKYVSVWVCKGFKEHGGAFDRWHITSTDIS